MIQTLKSLFGLPRRSRTPSDGTHRFLNIHDLICRTPDGRSRSARKEGILKRFLEEEGAFFQETLSRISFRFSGSGCSVLFDGRITQTCPCCLSNGRLVIGHGNGCLCLGYRAEAQTIFVWDLEAFRSLGCDLSEYFGTGGTDMEIWVAMQREK